MRTWVPMLLSVLALSALQGPAYGAGGEQWLPKDRYAEFHIVVSDQAPSSDVAAAEEFKRLWQKATELDIPIRSEQDGGVTVWIGAMGVPKPMLQDMKMIWNTVVGDANEAIINMDPGLGSANLPDGGYCIKTIGESLLIIGSGSEGTRRGVEAYFRDNFGYTAPDAPLTMPDYLPRVEIRSIPATTVGWSILQLAFGLVALFVIHWAFNRYYGEEVPIPIALVLTVAALLSCVYFFKVNMGLLSAVWGPYAQPLTPILTFGLFFWPVRGYVITLMQSFGKRSTEFMYGGSNAPSMTGDDYLPPQVYKVSHEVNDRVQEFRRIFASEPSSPRALFEAAQVLEQHNYYDEAAEMYREVIQLFHKDSAVWAEANFRLSALHENALFNRRGAVDILKRIVSRAPDTEYGRLAKNRLSDLDTPEAAGGTV